MVNICKTLQVSFNFLNNCFRKKTVCKYKFNFDCYFSLKKKGNPFNSNSTKFLVTVTLLYALLALEIIRLLPKQ